MEKESQVSDNYANVNGDSVLKNFQLTYFLSSSDDKDYEKYSEAFGFIIKPKTDESESNSDKKKIKLEKNDKVPLLSIDDLKTLSKPLVAIFLKDKKYISYLIPNKLVDNGILGYRTSSYDRQSLTSENDIKNIFMSLDKQISDFHSHYNEEQLNKNSLSKLEIISQAEDTSLMVNVNEEENADIDNELNNELSKAIEISL